jgi:uncharacterized protein
MVAIDPADPALERICREYSVAALYLFGSHARGTAGRMSDIDLGVLFDVAPSRTIDAYPVDLIDALISVFGQPVDVVVLDHASPDLVHRVLRDGRLLVNRNPSRRVSFEVQKRNEFFDIQPFLRRYREAALRALGPSHDRP